MADVIQREVKIVYSSEQNKFKVTDRNDNILFWLPINSSEEQKRKLFDQCSKFLVTKDDIIPEAKQSEKIKFEITEDHIAQGLTTLKDVFQSLSRKKR